MASHFPYLGTDGLDQRDTSVNARGTIVLRDEVTGSKSSKDKPHMNVFKVNVKCVNWKDGQQAAVKPIRICVDTSAHHPQDKKASWPSLKEKMVVEFRGFLVFNKNKVALTLYAHRKNMAILEGESSSPFVDSIEVDFIGEVQRPLYTNKSGEKSTTLRLNIRLHSVSAGGARVPAETAVFVMDNREEMDRAHLSFVTGTLVEVRGPLYAYGLKAEDTTFCIRAISLRPISLPPKPEESGKSAGGKKRELDDMTPSASEDDEPAEQASQSDRPSKRQKLELSNHTTGVDASGSSSKASQSDSTEFGTSKDGGQTVTLPVIKDEAATGEGKDAAPKDGNE